MPGAVRRILVKAGERVRRGAELVVLEAMKMEHVVRAPADGVVETVHVAAGDQVVDGTDLVAFRAEGS
jgi:biotin carboxyl carrier protein